MISAQLRRYYQHFEDAERLRGVWDGGAGLAFVERERLADGDWSAPADEAPGFYHFFIQTIPHIVHGVRDGEPIRRGRLPAGTVRIVRPEERVRASGFGDARSLQICLTPTSLADEAEFLALTTDSLQFRDGGPRHDLGLERLAAAHGYAVDAGFSGNELFFQQVRLAIVRRLIVMYANRPLALAGAREILVSARAQRLIDYVEEHLSVSITLDDLARLAGISKFHLSRAFRNTMGLSPHAYVVQRRLAKALWLIKGSRTALSQVARACGFADHAHLSRAFKAHFGRQPSAAREWPARRFDATRPVA
jgi:AraC-like DNA-binding protein